MAIDPLIPPPEFLARAAELGIEFEPTDLAQFGRFLALLLEANKSFNLTAVTEPAQAWMRHILDSLTLLPVLGALEPGKEGEPLRVIDIGSGGGLPGIPLAISMPDARFVLVDATGKKATFLRATARELGLKNVIVMQNRAERLGQDPLHRNRYDAAMARAVGNLAILAELLVPLVRPGGVALAIKGARADDELAAAAEAIRIVGATHDQTIDTPTGRIVVLSKVRPTPNLYPRRDGEPASKPLGIEPKKAERPEKAPPQANAKPPRPGTQEPTNSTGKRA